MVRGKERDRAEVFAAAPRCAMPGGFTPHAGGVELAGCVKTVPVSAGVVSVHHFPAWGAAVVVAAVSQNHLG